MAGNLDMVLEALDVPSALHDSMVEKYAQQSGTQIPAATTGSEPSAPDANSATVTAKQETAHSETPSQTKEETTPENPLPDDIQEIDPAKKIKIGDEVIDWQTLQYRSMKKADLDKEKFQLNKEKEILELEKQDSANAKYWKEQMENDDFTRNYLQLKSSGMPRDEAFVAAMKVGGIQLPAQAATIVAQAQPAFGIDVKDLADKLPKLPANIEPNSDEHTRWYTEVYEPAKMAIVAEMTGKRIVAEIESNRVIEQRQAMEAEAKKQQIASTQQAAIALNQSQLNALPQLLWTMYGIEANKLTPEQTEDVKLRLTNALSENEFNIDDPQWMAANKIKPMDVKSIVREAFPEGKNPYTTSQKSSLAERPKANATPPLTAGRNSAPATISTHGAERYGSAMEAAVAGLDM
jgi:hypothetical protein